MQPQPTESYFLKNLAKNIAGSDFFGMNYLKQVGGSYMEGGKNIIQGFKDSSNMIQGGLEQMREGKTLGEQFKGLAKGVGGTLYGGLRAVGEVAKQTYAPIAPIISPAIGKTIQAGSYIADKSGLADYFGDKLESALPIIDKVSKWAKDNPYKMQVAKDILYTTSLLVANQKSPKLEIKEKVPEFMRSNPGGEINKVLFGEKGTVVQNFKTYTLYGKEDPSIYTNKTEGIFSKDAIEHIISDTKQNIERVDPKLAKYFVEKIPVSASTEVEFNSKLSGIIKEYYNIPKHSSKLFPGVNKQRGSIENPFYKATPAESADDFASKLEAKKIEISNQVDDFLRRSPDGRKLLDVKNTVVKVQPSKTGYSVMEETTGGATFDEKIAFLQRSKEGQELISKMTGGKLKPYPIEEIKAIESQMPTPAKTAELLKTPGGKEELKRQLSEIIKNIK